jgi:hypothetical protein
LEFRALGLGLAGGIMSWEFKEINEILRKTDDRRRSIAMPNGVPALKGGLMLSVIDK